MNLINHSNCTVHCTFNVDIMYRHPHQSKKALAEENKKHESMRIVCCVEDFYKAPNFTETCMQTDVDKDVNTIQHNWGGRYVGKNSLKLFAMNCNGIKNGIRACKQTPSMRTDKLLTPANQLQESGERVKCANNALCSTMNNPIRCLTFLRAR